MSVIRGGPQPLNPPCSGWKSVLWPQVIAEWLETKSSWVPKKKPREVSRTVSSHSPIIIHALPSIHTEPESPLKLLATSASYLLPRPSVPLNSLLHLCLGYFFRCD